MSDATSSAADPTRQLLFPTFRTWHPILDHPIARVLFALIVEGVLFSIFHDIHNKPALIPFLIATLPCVIAGAIWLRPLYRWHVSIWKRLTITDLLPPVFAFIMLGLIWGMVGSGFGLFHLFWHDNPWISFFAGMSVGMFWAMLGYLVYLLYANDLYARSRRPEINEADGGLTKRIRKWFNRIAGLFGYEKSPDVDLQPGPQGQRRKQAIETSLKAGDMEKEKGRIMLAVLLPLVLLSLIPVFYSTSTKQDREQWTTYADGIWRLLQTIEDRWPFALGLIMAMAGFVLLRQLFIIEPTPEETQKPDRDSKRLVAEMRKKVGNWFEEIRHTVSGISFWIGIATSVAMAVLIIIQLTVRPTYYLLSWAAVGFYICLICWLICRWCREPGAKAADMDECEWVLRLRTRNLFFIWALLFAGGHLLNQLFDILGIAVGYAGAAVSISMLLMAISVGYGWLRFYRRGAATLSLLTLLVVYGAMYSLQNYPHRLEGLGDYYRLESCTYRDRFDPELHKPSLYHYETLRVRNAAEGLSNTEVLDRWSRHVSANAQIDERWKIAITLASVALNVDLTNVPPPKPPLIIVTTSGGASNSAIFTINLLLELERLRPGITRHVRIMCGASGGMFGAAYFRSQCESLDRMRDPAERAQLFESMRNGIAQDFLSSVTNQWVFKDMAMGFCPFPYRHDRGMALELSWQNHLGDGIRMPYSKLKEQEATGAYPSLIFSPVLVEDGRQLLISTLDLNRLVEPDFNADPDDFVERLRAVEFFKLFPKAQDFRLSTAARLNATFPLVSPAAVLPTSPPRRAVDAGYYDNHGLSVAVAWIDAHRTWLKENTSEVILLQFRPWFWVFPEDVILPDGTFMFDTIDERDSGRFDRPVTEAERQAIVENSIVNWWWKKPRLQFDEYTTPLQGGYSSLRTGMVLRGSQQLRLLQESLPKSGGFEGVTTCTFVGNLDSSMSWYLPRHHVLLIEATVRKAADPKWKPANGENEWYLKEPFGKRYQAAVYWNRYQLQRLFDLNSLKAYIPPR